MDKHTDQQRELLTQQRQQQDLRQEAMRSRTEAELQTPVDSILDEQARESLADQRHDQDQLSDAMLERSQEELQ